jgi:hypothetical protein
LILVTDVDVQLGANDPGRALVTEREEILETAPAEIPYQLAAGTRSGLAVVAVGSSARSSTNRPRQNSLYRSPLSLDNDPGLGVELRGAFDFCHSFGATTTLKCGAGFESPIRSSSISTAKNKTSSCVCSFSHVSA